MSTRSSLPSLLSWAARTIGCLGAWVAPSLTKEPEPALWPAWALYQSGNFAQAKTAAARLMEHKKNADAGLYLLCLISHLEGQYPQSIAYYQNIRRSYPKRKLLAEAVAWSYIHLGNYAGAIRHLEGSRAPQDPALLAVLGYWKEHPLKAQASGVAEIPFTEDGLSPWMPGFKVKINGQEVVARLDTGGSFIHLSPTWAKKLGVRSTAGEKGFASLEEVSVGYGGFVDLELGTFVLQNVPVYVLDHLDDQSKNLAAAFGEELGPIVGTNVFQQFLTTIDGPSRRMVLSPRGDSIAEADHASRLSGEATEIPFTMWLDHFMTAGGSLNDALVRLFFDSGLVTGNAEQGQASLLVPQPVLESWGLAVPEADRLAVLPAALSLGGMKRENLTACAVPQATWHAMGDWGGVAVDALISWGFLKDLTWTIDFDRRVYNFRK